MSLVLRRVALPLLGLAGLLLPLFGAAAELPRAYIDGTGQGWRELKLADFDNVNGTADTWVEQDGVIHGTGQPIGGAKSKQQFRNFELVVEWRHLSPAGNSGLFVWCPEEAFAELKPGQLPRHGIEVQVLDLGYETNWQKAKGKPSDWFTSHGDVFPVGKSKMTAFTPEITYTDASGAPYHVGSKTSSRSFPTSRRVRPVGEWNHYYVRAMQGEVRLWVNGEEVCGGHSCEPCQGHLALEAEGAPIEFRNLRVRELP